ncbi:MAG: putative quinol monooxygenase [Brevundimonas sp.]
MPRRRESVIGVLGKRRQAPEGCLSYVVAQDPDTLWVTEVWTDADAHRHSLQRPDIKAGFAGVLSWIATMHDPIVTEPVGGIGLD